jgi:hypothetical protein
MRTTRFNSPLALCLILIAVFACNFSATTANISSVKLSKDSSGNPEASSFGPNDTVYAVATVANSASAVKVRARVLFVDVQGQQANSPLPGAEAEVTVPDSRPAIFDFSKSGQGWPNGRYRIEVTMLNAETNQQIDQKTVEFTVTGGRDGNATSDDGGAFSWTTTASSLSGQNGQRFTYTCPANGTAATVWGTDVYTADSSICTAAVHAGVITLARGGSVTIKLQPGAASYQGSARNGVESRPYGSWSSSFVVIR